MSTLQDKIQRGINKSYRRFNWASQQILTLPKRWQLSHDQHDGIAEDTIGNLKVRYVDGESLAGMYRELFIDEYNDFWCSHDEPVILDCGSNIGISVLRFKHLYPKARITAFEADPDIAQILSYNLAQNGAADVQVVPAAVYRRTGKLVFSSHQVEAGHVLNTQEMPIVTEENMVEIDCVRLADYLDQHIDFIKMDIEGAEYKVLPDCADKLHNVDKMVIEVHFNTTQSKDLALIYQVLADSGFQVGQTVWNPPSRPINLKQPFKKSHDDFDQWIVIYAWR